MKQKAGDSETTGLKKLGIATIPERPKWPMADICYLAAVSDNAIA